jgi:hypothetical protein
MQRKWMCQCGTWPPQRGEPLTDDDVLAGYLARYGDPDRAPLDRNGNCKTFPLPDELNEGLRPVEDVPGWYYAPMVGKGGTAIYNADMAKLLKLLEELAPLAAWEEKTRQ